MALDWKEKVPLVYYSDLYKRIDVKEAALRCNIQFDEIKNEFALRYMGIEYKITYPEFKVKSGGVNTSEKILFLRYICEGAWSQCKGKLLSYREIPWGELYYKNFEGRCVMKLARVFGNSPDLFSTVMEKSAGLKSEKISNGKYAYRFEFLNGLYIGFILWPGDDEFPSAAQIVFDDNVPDAFKAEDIAVLCETVISRLKSMSADFI